jgi:hypothetical protein
MYMSPHHILLLVSCRSSFDDDDEDDNDFPGSFEEELAYMDMLENGGSQEMNGQVNSRR